ncbi:MAG: phosphatase PAP2 family protein [Clostridia bacterium]|nr:phosphatase PAP2 family protein [Clostridia bacterium]
MPWEASIIQALQTMSNGFTDTVFGIFTYLGDEIFVVAVMAFVYWCVSKRLGFKFMNVYFLSCGVNTVIKAIVQRPRPFDAYEGIVKSIGEETGGYSFPSGHTNNITTLSTLSVMGFKKHRKIFIPLGIGLTLLVMFTRLFLGQHYLTDVLCSAFMAILMVIVFSLLYDLLGDHEERIAFGGVPIAIIGAIVVSIIQPDAETVKHVLEITGVLISVQIGYFIDKKYIGFESKTTIAKQFLKILIGGAGALAIFLGLKFAFNFDTSFWLYGFFRYALLGLWLTLGAPLIFKKLGFVEEKKELDAQNT